MLPGILVLVQFVMHTVRKQFHYIKVMDYKQRLELLNNLFI